MKFRTLLLGISALLVAACAAYFSVTGLSKLFAGAELQVIIMAGSLELAKLISAGFLYNYWKKLHGLLKTYMTIAVVILMFITSVGIYGFLTSSYKVTSDQLGVIDKQTETIQLKRDRYSEEVGTYTLEREQLNQSINELSKGLANNVIQYKDEDGNIITTTSSATRKVLQNQLDDFKIQRDKVTQKMDVLNDSITSLDLQILDLKSNNEVAAEIGPLRYISDVTGEDMDTVVNWLALFIVFVFDPLAVTLVIAFSAGVKIDRDAKQKKKVENSYEVYGEEKLPDTELSSDYAKSLSKYEEKFGTDFAEAMDDALYEASQEEPEQPMMEPNIERINGISRAEYEAGEWKQPYDGKPYYYHPWFNWNKTNRWIQDPHAVDFWLKYRGGTVDLLKSFRKNYPDNFTQKIY